MQIALDKGLYVILVLSFVSGIQPFPMKPWQYN